MNIKRAQNRQFKFVDFATSIFKKSTSLVSFVFAFIAVLTVFPGYFNQISKVNAASSNTVSFQGKIVRNATGSEGINVSSSDTTCIVDAGADTCDFKVTYYDDASQTTTLGSEIFSNVEIGDYDGVFNLALGSQTFTAGAVSSFNQIFADAYNDVHMVVEFAPDGTTFTENFGIMALRATPYAMFSSYLDGLSSGDFVQLAPNLAQVSSSANTSIFLNQTGSGNLMNLQVGGVSKLFVDNNGKVGIGTTSPSQALDLIGNLALENTTSADTGVIYKGSDRFIHNFQHPTGDTAVPDGQNTFVGINAGNFTMGSTATGTWEASYNTGIGVNSLQSNTTGGSNSAMGSSSLQSNTTGYYNSAVGSFSLYSNTTGSYNSAMGISSLQNNTTGSENAAIGDSSLYRNTTGNNNSAIGSSPLYNNTTGYGNSAMGSYSLYSNTTGIYNSAMGYNSLMDNATGIYNSAMGYNSLQSNTTGYFNSAVGEESLQYNTTGSYNSAIGNDAGSYIADESAENTTGDYNLFLGGYTKALADDDQNEIVIGYNATGIGSNSVVLGNDSIVTTALKGNVGIGTTSPLTNLQVSGSFGFGIGTIAFPSGANVDHAIQGFGGISNYAMTIQDGNGRVNQYWNAYYDSTDSRYEYLVGGEASSRYLMDEGTHAWYVAPTSTNAGDPITWIEAMDIDNTGYVTFHNGHNDLAENYHISNSALRGMLVSTDSNSPKSAIKSSKDNTKLLGVISSAPGLVLDDSNGVKMGTKTKSQYTNEKAPIALSGTAPTLVYISDNSIKVGDYIGISEIAGFGTKAVDGGIVVGTALESLNFTESCTPVSSISDINWPEDDSMNSLKPCYKLPDNRRVGKIMVALQPNWYPGDALVQSGEFKLPTAQETLAEIKPVLNSEFNNIDAVELTFPSLVYTNEFGAKSVDLQSLPAVFAKAFDDQNIEIQNLTDQLALYDINVPISDISNSIKTNSTDIVDLKVQILNLQAEIGTQSGTDSSLYWNYTGSSIEALYPLVTPSLYANDAIFATFTTNMLDAGFGNFVVDADGNLITKGKVTIENLIYGLDGTVTFADGIETPKITSKSYVVDNDLGYEIAGTSAITANTIEVTIPTAAVSQFSRILITPRSNTFGEVLYVGSIIDGESFTVNINNTQSEDIEFDWWIIDTKPPEVVEVVP